MNSWISTKRPLLLALSMLGMSTILPATQAQMMMVPGQFNVTPGGAATYSIPIEVPPGTAGMVPSLSLNYSSQGGNGLLGVGWSLGGLPSISRCGKTIAQDGTTKGVEYSSDDRFCLEGQKLIAINGTYGGDGTEYRTEIDGFSKIVSYTNSGINGPAWFKVWTKSGQIMEFGNTADSQMKASSELSYVRVWAANKISDVMGNYLTVTYNTSQSTGESFPTRIDYTGNDGESLSPYNSVRFNYENRSDDSTRYLAGSKLSLTKRLKTIKTYAGSTIVKQYKLNYSQSSSTDRSLLKDIELCAGASGPCLPKTVFDFSQSTFGFGSALGGRFSNTILKSSAGYQIFPADWNGDGHADLLAFKPNGGNNQWYRGDGLGNFTPQSTLISLSHIANGELVFGDFNGDALPDIFWFNNSNNGANKLILNTSTNNLISFAAPIFNPITNVELTVPTSQNNGSELRAGDFNGDGLTDLFWYNSLFGLKNLFINTGTNNFTVYNNVVSVNFGVPDECDQAPPIFNCRARVSDYNVQVLDLNANGTSDLHVLREVTVTNDAGEPEFQGKNYESYFLLNDLSFSFDTFTENNDLTEEEEDYIRGRVRGVRRSQFSDDWNGDGVTDVRFVNSDRDTEIAINRGDASLQKPNIDFNGGVNRRFLSVDLDSNGLTDLLRYDTSSGQNTVYLNKDGLDFSSVASVITPSNINTDGNIYVADFNGDGLNDLLWVGENLGTNYIYLNQSTVPDLMTSVTTGLGSTTAFEYKIGTDSSVYTKDTGGNAATYPTVDLLAPMRLISKVEADDGIGGTYDSTYKYVGGKYDTQGRGFLGFRQFIVEDDQTGIIQTQTFKQSYPWIGSLEEDQKTIDPNNDGNIVTLNKTINSFASIDLGGTRRFPYIWKTTVDSTDLNGSSFPRVTTEYEYETFLTNGDTDTFGNVSKVEVYTPDNAVKTTVSTYHNDIAKWHIGRLLTATVTSDVSGNANPGSGSGGGNPPPPPPPPPPPNPNPNFNIGAHVAIITFLLM